MSGFEHGFPRGILGEEEKKEPIVEDVPEMNSGESDTEKQSEVLQSSEDLQVEYQRLKEAANLAEQQGDEEEYNRLLNEIRATEAKMNGMEAMETEEKQYVAMEVPTSERTPNTYMGIEGSEPTDITPREIIPEETKEAAETPAERAWKEFEEKQARAKNGGVLPENFQPLKMPAVFPEIFADMQTEREQASTETSEIAPEELAESQKSQEAIFEQQRKQADHDFRVAQYERNRDRGMIEKITGRGKLTAEDLMHEEALRMNEAVDARMEKTGKPAGTAQQEVAQSQEFNPDNSGYHAIARRERFKSKFPEIVAALDEGDFDGAQEKYNVQRKKAGNDGSWPQMYTEGFQDLLEQKRNTFERANPAEVPPNKSETATVENTPANPEILKEIEAESEKLAANLETLETHQEKFDQQEIPAGKEIEALTLRTKIGKSVNRFFDKLSKMNSGKLLTGSALVGIVAGIASATAPEIAHVASFLPESLQHFLQSPESAGNLIWSMTNNGHFDMPSMQNYLHQASAFKDAINPDMIVHAGGYSAEAAQKLAGETETVRRIGSGLLNTFTVGSGITALGFAGKALGKIGNHFSKQKTK
ncbi:MAG TPA: hypothetical protein VFM02_01880 [Candidatus Paceibacterota bacterium]|nr:hypothetical protein [Candidatus Paceibacterota bacterium]